MGNQGALKIKPAAPATATKHHGTGPPAGSGNGPNRSNDTLNGQLDLERHGGPTKQGVCTRISQRLLAMAAVIWHNRAAGEPVRRSLTAYDH
jgi:hypothetical protein